MEVGLGEGTGASANNPGDKEDLWPFPALGALLFMGAGDRED